MFYKNILNVLSFPNFSTFEKRDRASGIKLNSVLGSFLFISWKNCLTKLSISGSGSWKRRATSHISLFTFIMSFRERWVITVKVVFRTRGSFSCKFWYRCLLYGSIMLGNLWRRSPIAMIMLFFTIEFTFGLLSSFIKWGNFCWQKVELKHMNFE